MKKKIYKYPKTESLVKKLKFFWKKYKHIEDEYYEQLQIIEKNMEEITGIPNIEFFFCDNEIVGIGNVERTMELIHRKELE